MDQEKLEQELEKLKERVGKLEIALEDQLKERAAKKSSYASGIIIE